MNTAILGLSSVIVHPWEYDRKPSLEEKIADFFGETRFGQGQESKPVSVEHRSVEYSRSRAAGYPKIG